MANKLPTLTMCAWSNVSTRVKIGNDGDNLTDWTVGDSVILAIQIDATTPWGPEVYKVRWRASGGTFADLGAATEIAYESTSALTNGDAVSSGESECSNVPGGSTWEDGLEAEGTGTFSAFTHTDEYYTELQIALNTANAQYATTYELELYAVTSGAPLATLTVTLTSESAPVTFDLLGSSSTHIHKSSSGSLTLPPQTSPTVVLNTEDGYYTTDLEMKFDVFIFQDKQSFVEF